MKNNVVIGILLAILALAVLGLYLKAPVQVENKTVQYDDSALKLGLQTVSNQVNNVSATLSSLDEFGTKANLTKQNETAKNLVIEEISKKSFKKDLVLVLNDNSVANHSVEDYKSISDVRYTIKSVEIDDNSAEVKVTLKVDFEDYEDSDYQYTATITALFSVEDLVVSDNFSDADASYDLSDLSVLRFKELN